jgi:hypothetical protein
MNCLRSLKYIKKIYSKYKKYGLEIKLIHPPEWKFEKNRENIISAFKKYNIKFPVIIDKNKKVINKLRVNFWPTQILIKNGNILYRHIGEGSYKNLENKIIDYLKIKSRNIFGKEPKYNKFPTVYCGKKKNGRILREENKLKFGAVYSDGRCIQKQEYIKPTKNESSITILTKGKTIDFVAHSLNKKSITIIIKLNNKLVRRLTINKPRLYNLMKLNNNRQSKLTIITPKNIAIYSFSFQ